MLAIRLNHDIEQRLNALAEKTGRTKTYYVRMAILRYLEDMEDIYLAEKAYEDIRSGKEKIYTLDQVGEHLDLAD